VTVRIVMVLTSHDRLGDTGRKTGYWLEELAAPWYAFRATGAEIALASPKGGQPPLDPESVTPANCLEASRRFQRDRDAQRRLAETAPLAGIDPAAFDAVFYPGGHGPMWDLVDNPDSIRLIEALWAAGKPVAAICHGPAVLANARDSRGDYIVRGRAVTSFSNAEEASIGLTDAVPFLVEDMLVGRGGIYSSAPNFEAHSCRDGMLVTGQNPASAPAAAELVLEAIGTR
jgi:putative intracellular protease/amidase